MRIPIRCRSYPLNTVLNTSGSNDGSNDKMTAVNVSNRERAKTINCTERFSK